MAPRLQIFQRIRPLQRTYIFHNLYFKTHTIETLHKILASHRSFSLKKVLKKFVSKEAQNLTLLPSFWTVLSSQAAFSRFCLNGIRHGFRQAFFKSTIWGYGSSWAAFCWAKHAPKSKNNSSEDSEGDDRLEKKYILLTLWRVQSQLQVFLPPTNF